MADLLGDALLLSGSEPLMVAGVVALGVGPARHFRRGNDRRGATSIALRLALPATGMLLVADSQQECPPDAGLGCGVGKLAEIAAGGALGLVAAQLLDGFALSTEVATSERSVDVTPILLPVDGGGTVGVGGVF